MPATATVAPKSAPAKPAAVKPSAPKAARPDPSPVGILTAHRFPTAAKAEALPAFARLAISAPVSPSPVVRLTPPIHTAKPTLAAPASTLTKLPELAKSTESKKSVVLAKPIEPAKLVSLSKPIDLAKQIEPLHPTAHCEAPHRWHHSQPPHPGTLVAAQAGANGPLGSARARRAAARPAH